MSDRFATFFGVAQGTVLTDIQIPNTRDGGFHPHLCDLYEPAGNIIACIAALHGGGGTKRQFAASLGVLAGGATPTTTTVNWRALLYWRCALLVPQGRYCTGVDPGLGAGNNPWNPNDVTVVSDLFPNGIPNWSNWVFWSGVDDPQFVKDIAAWMADRYGTVLRILAGHSSGGIMVNRAWAEHAPPGGFSVYCTTSGPAAEHYRSNPVTPVIVKPLLSQFGAQDTTLQISDGRFYSDPWSLSNPTVANVYIPPLVIGELTRLQFRVNAYNAANSMPPETVRVEDGVTEPCPSPGTGFRTTWRYSDNANIVRLIHDAGHDSKSMQRANGRGHIGDWMAFALANNALG